MVVGELEYWYGKWEAAMFLGGFCMVFFLQTYFDCQELKDKPAPDFDERLTMNEIWKAGEGARPMKHSCHSSSLAHRSPISRVFRAVGITFAMAPSPMIAPGGDEEEGSWLEGAGLKFHTTADKAFSMAKQRFKESDAD